MHNALIGVPASAREEVWQWLSWQYQATHLPQWNFPEELCGEEAFARLSKMATEYEHSITVDIGEFSNTTDRNEGGSCMWAWFSTLGGVCIVRDMHADVSSHTV